MSSSKTIGTHSKAESQEAPSGNELSSIAGVAVGGDLFLLHDSDYNTFLAVPGEATLPIELPLVAPWRIQLAANPVASLSSDGRYIAFIAREVKEGKIAPEDHHRLCRWDRETDELIWVDESLDLEGRPFLPQLSADGQLLLFHRSSESAGRQVYLASFE